MIGLETDAPVVGREVTFGPSSGLGSGRSRRGLAIGGLVAVAVIVGTVAVGRGGDDSASSPTTTAAVEVATSSTTVADSPTTSTTAPEATTTTSLPEREALGTGPMLGERTGLELWFQVSFSGPLSSPSGIYRIDLDNAVRERLTSTSYSTGQPVVAVADATGLGMYGSGSAVFHVDRGGVVVRGPQMDGQVVSTNREGYWLERGGESSPNGLPLTLEHYRFDGSLTVSVAIPHNAYVQGGAGDGKFVLRGADLRSFLFDAVLGEISQLPGSVSGAAGGSVLTVRCSEKLDCPTVFIGSDGVESVVSDGVDGSGYFGPFGPFGRAQQVSPDGKWLVRPDFPKYPNDFNGSDPVSMAVLNPRTGERVVLGNVVFDDVMNGQHPTAWSPDARWVFAVTLDGIAAWRPGLSAPVVIPIGEGRAVVSAVAAGVSPTSAAA
jgi:hypothetical protein